VIDPETRSIDLPKRTVTYTLRRSPRARSLRVVIHPQRGVVVTVPAERRGWRAPVPQVEAFLRERESWLVRHLDRHERDRATLAARGGVADGATIRYRGELHGLRLIPASAGQRRSTVSREGGTDRDELVVRLVPRDAHRARAVLEPWFRARAREAIEQAIARHAASLGVRPLSITVRDQRTRWGSASRAGRLAFSWRLVLAPPDALDTVVVHELAHLRLFGHGPAFWAIVESRRPDHSVWRRWLRDHAAELHGALDEPS
jgi:predicted metal-dependent hydrolase